MYATFVYGMAHSGDGVDGKTREEGGESLLPTSLPALEGLA